jgi:hypothetical protein
MLRCPFGEAHGRSQAMDRARVEYHGSSLASVGHGYPLLFKPHPGGPRLRFDDLPQGR